MVEQVARIRFSWNSELTRCRATAFDATNQTLGEVVIELTAATRQQLWTSNGPAMQYRVEEQAERHLRAMLDLRY